MKILSSSVASIHSIRLGLGRGLTHSETAFVSTSANFVGFEKQSTLWLCFARTASGVGFATYSDGTEEPARSGGCAWFSLPETKQESTSIHSG